jgi:hypothetical protein
VVSLQVSVSANTVSGATPMLHVIVEIWIKVQKGKFGWHEMLTKIVLICLNYGEVKSISSLGSVQCSEKVFCRCMVITFDTWHKEESIPHRTIACFRVPHFPRNLPFLTLFIRFANIINLSVQIHQAGLLAFGTTGHQASTEAFVSGEVR